MAMVETNAACYITAVQQQPSFYVEAQIFPSSPLNPRSVMSSETGAAPLIQGSIIYLSMITL